MLLFRPGFNDRLLYPLQPGGNRRLLARVFPAGPWQLSCEDYQASCLASPPNSQRRVVFRRGLRPGSCTIPLREVRIHGGYPP
jgi:hypothetical protein